MKVIFLGVGEAFDERIPNTSILVLSNNTNLLLDCGYTTPAQLWKFNSNQSFLDAIYISHSHADHYFGIPPLLVRMWEEKRKKPLTIICQKGLKKIIEKLVDYGYQGFLSKLGFFLGKFRFRINFIEVDESRSVKLNGLKLSFAPTIHPVSNLAVKVDDGKKSFCYSGDGMFNETTEKIYKNADLVIHEAYLYDEARIGHACMTNLVKMAERNNVKCLALIHINRFFRRKELKLIKKNFPKNKKVKIIIPNLGSVVNLNDRQFL